MVEYALGGGPKGKGIIGAIIWSVPHWTPSVTQQTSLGKQVFSKTCHNQRKTKNLFFQKFWRW